MQTIYAEVIGPVCDGASVLGRSSWRPELGALRPYITQLGAEHTSQLSALLCSLDKSARINRFGHPASDPSVQAYAKDSIAKAAYVVGALNAGRLIGVGEVFATRNGVAEAAFAIDADYRRRGLGLALLEAARRWAAQEGIVALRMVISRNNWPMRLLAHKAGARFDFDLDEISAEISVAAAGSLNIAA
jgi:GNAT superfamily N-acetyltransferase